MAITVHKAPQRGPSKAEKFNAAMSGGLDLLTQYDKEAKSAQALKNLTGQDLAGLSPEIQQKVAEQYAKYGAKTKAIESLGFGDRLRSPGQYGPREEAMQDVVDPETGSIKVGDVKVPSLYPEDQIVALSQIDPNMANQMRKHNDDVIAQKRHEENLEQKEISAARKETTPLRKQYADQAKYAKEAQKNKEQQLRLIRKGNIDSPERVFFASLLPGALGNKLLSADTQLYRAGLFEEFGVLKSMFPGQIRVKEIELLEDKLASLEKSDEAKEKILETGIAKLEIPKIRARAAQRVEKEYPKSTLLEFEEKVDELAHDELEKAYNNITQAYEKIYFEYAPEKNTLIDKDGHVYKDIPKNLLKSFYEEGNKEGLELRPL